MLAYANERKIRDKQAAPQTRQPSDLESPSHLPVKNKRTIIKMIKNMSENKVFHLVQRGMERLIQKHPLYKKK